MIQVSVESACSFAHSLDEELSNPAQFFEATTGWLSAHQPVLAGLSREMALRLCGDETSSLAAQAVVGYVLRLLTHAEANQDLRCQWSDEECPHVCFPLGEPGEGHRRFCCKRKPRASDTPA